MENEGCSGKQNINFGVDMEKNDKFEMEKNHGEETADSFISTYNPQVSEQIKPTEGQEFKTLGEVQDFYNAYAKEAGFSVRSYSSKKRKGSDEITRKEFVCYKQGKSPRFADVDVTRRRGILKQGCNAKLVVLKSKSGSFVVRIFTEGHNHPLSTPRKTHLLRSHRQITPATKSLTEQLSMVNVPQHQQYNLFQVQHGGIENVGCTQKDLYNHERDKRVEVKGHDGDMLYEYFKTEQRKNPSFFFKLEAGDEQRITRCFWADATSRRAYKFYGDVVIFDTYNNNRYELIFAPLMGVNNHGQTTILACAFLSGETVDDFMWLFKQFLEAMPGDAPKMIITNQDHAMTKAIREAFPTTFHRYCSWHILTKFSEKIDAIKYSRYYREFSDCIWKSESCEEFDLKWIELVQKSGLNDHNWLNSMYELRAKWVPAYVNHVFSANMSSSQRAESCHSFFKKFVSKSNSLVDFMIQFGRGLVKQRHEELIADNKDMIEKPKVKLNHDFLMHMVELYTHEMFYKFQDEMWESLNYSFGLLRETENQQVFRIQRRNSETNKVREIIYDKQLNYASCSCRKFESSGIPCRHILGYLIKFHDFSRLPEQYILKRWTKDAKVGTVIDDGGIVINDDNAYLMKRSQLIQASLKVVDKALTSEEAMKIYAEGLENISQKINALVGCATSVNAIGGTSARFSSDKSNPIF